ncbi:MAG: RNA polymerase sigma factor [Melioribacteraceae bacterium]|nr:RNA polymerase sigma factor [Melioribacteraceae bacterium]
MKLHNLTYHNFSKDELEKHLRLAITGDSESFTNISTAIRSIAFNYFEIKYKLGKLQNIEDAEDLANNVYLSFAEQYHKIQNIEHWLRRVLFLVFVNWYKKQKKYPHFELDEAYTISVDSTDPDISLDSQKAVEILNKLSEKKRDIIRMRFWEGLKFSEIADKLGKNEAAIKKMLYRTLEEIKIKLE